MKQTHFVQINRKSVVVARVRALAAYVQCTPPRAILPILLKAVVYLTIIREVKVVIKNRKESYSKNLNKGYKYKKRNLEFVEVYFNCSVAVVIVSIGVLVFLGDVPVFLTFLVGFNLFIRRLFRYTFLFLHGRNTGLLHGFLYLIHYGRYLGRWLVSREAFH